MAPSTREIIVLPSREITIPAKRIPFQILVPLEKPFSKMPAGQLGEAEDELLSIGVCFTTAPNMKSARMAAELSMRNFRIALEAGII